MRVSVITVLIHVNPLEQWLFKNFLVAKKILPLVIITLTAIISTIIMTILCHLNDPSEVCDVLFKDFWIAPNDNNLCNAI